MKSLKRYFLPDFELEFEATNEIMASDVSDDVDIDLGGEDEDEDY